MSADESKSSMVSVSSTSSKTNVSESSQHKNAGLGQSHVFPLKGLPLANDSNTLTNETLEQPITGASDLSETQSLITFTKQISSLQEKDEKLTSPKQDQDSGLAGLSSVTPDSLGQKVQDSPDDKIIRSSESTPTPPGSGSPQLDQLLSDLEEMTLKFIPEKLDPPLSESSDESPDIDEIYKFEDLSPEDQCPMQDGDSVSVSVLSVIQHTDDHKNVGVIDPTHFQTPIQDEPELVSVIPNVTEISEVNVQSSHGTHIDNPVFPTVPISIPESAKRFCEDMKSSLNSEGFPLDVFQSSENDENAIKATFSVSSQNDIPEQNLANISEEDTTTDILQGQDEQESSTFFDSSDMTKETSTQSIQDQLPSLFDMTSVKPIHNEDLSSQSPSGLFSETVATARHFMSEELNSHLPSGSFKTPPNEDISRTNEEYSDKSLTPVDHECFDAQTTSFKDKTEITSSNSDEEYSIPTGHADTSSTTTIYTYMPPGYTEVMGGDVDSLTFEYSDPEPYFDCKQTGSDFSETEPDEPESRTRSSGGQQQEHFSQKGYRGVLLSSGSEDYEDAPFVHESFHDIPEENEELINDSEGSDEEFTLCEASHLPPVIEIGICDDTDNSLKREIATELGSMSESSDDEFLTTRIVRRRVVIQADEMPDLPSQSVTEEKYTDENGHIVVKRVTRKIIRKCVSADGVEHAEVSLEGTPQESISVAEGDGYSKVVKRTVLKSEGDQTEVTFVECEGASALREEAAESGKVSRIERTTVVEAERTMTHQGDPSLASDLPSAQDDFKQGPHA